jgi:hypothetical protein
MPVIPRPSGHMESIAMKAVQLSCAIMVAGIACVFSSSQGIAQQLDGVLGAPGTTVTLDGKQLPPPDPGFGGVIKDRASESTPWWPPRVVPPKGAPNVLLIMTDDQGFGAPSTFGGVIPTPSMDRIAREGLRYTTSTPRRFARRRGPRSSPDVTITRRDMVWSAKSRRGSRVTIQ